MAVWPLQILLFLLGGFAVAMLCFRRKWSSRIINLVLALLWLWMGVVYHLLHFSRINPAAYFFGAFFILQGLIFLIPGVLKGKLKYEFNMHTRGILGMLLLFFALVVYPLLSYFFEHRFPYSPTFGLPCPTTIFTFGVLMFLQRRPSWFVYIIPFLWSLLGFSAALTLGIKEDLGLLVAGLLGTLFLIFGKFKKEGEELRKDDQLLY
ncbi:DUF6064 family protein [Salinimicrobium flavum]|uniref:DUF6064 family protein n=1 Tax=Salinimicrobium flavum TaxID=1737065 RepID=A0ABW5J1Y9_9FLAO